MRCALFRLILEPVGAVYGDWPGVAAVPACDRASSCVWHDRVKKMPCGIAYHARTRFQAPAWCPGAQACLTRQGRMKRDTQVLGRALRHRKIAAVMVLLALVAICLQLNTMRLPWRGAIAGERAAPAAIAQLSRYQAVEQAKPVTGIRDNLSGLTYSTHTKTLFAVINRPPSLAELSTQGELLRLMPLEGADDPEGIAHIEGNWFAIADERRNRVHWVEIAPGGRKVVLPQGQLVALGDAEIKNFGVEGLGWDPQRRQLVAVTEKWPMQVLRISLPAFTPGTGVSPSVAIESWEPADPTGLPTTDLASVEVDPRTGNLLLLGEESSVLYEYDRNGDLAGMMPLWAGESGLERTIPQPEGVAMDGAGVLYLVSEPNLFYRFEKRS